MTFKRVTRFVFWSIAPSAMIACSQGASPGDPSADASDETQTVGPDSAQPNCAQSGPADATVPADVSLEASPEASETSSADEASSGDGGAQLGDAADAANQLPERMNYLRVFMRTFATRPLLLLKAIRLFG